MEAPFKYSPAIASILLDKGHSSDIYDICAVILDLTERGFIQWTEVPLDDKLEKSSDLDYDFELNLLRPLDHDILHGFERRIVDRIYGPTRLSDMLPKMDDIFEEMFTIKVRNSAIDLGLYQAQKGLKRNILNPLIAIIFFFVEFFSVLYLFEDITHNFWLLAPMYLIYRVTNKFLVSGCISREGNIHKIRWSEYQRDLKGSKIDLQQAISERKFGDIKFHLAFGKADRLMGDLTRFMFSN